LQRGKAQQRLVQRRQFLFERRHVKYFVTNAAELPSLH
jgi:hypothetical protein